VPLELDEHFKECYESWLERESIMYEVFHEENNNLLNVENSSISNHINV
jgi:hypothetical protein